MKQTELLGLNYILSALEKLEPNTPILFEGEKGTGKTSLAFQRARDFGAPEENILHINCGYLRKIDDSREMINALNRSSLFGEKKVLILDELHQLTKDAQSAWLIPLENLTERVLVMACTTEVSGLLDTLLRRFTRFRTKTLSNSESKLLIDKLCEENGFKLSKIAKVLLAEKSENIPGLIISNLPKIVGLEDEQEIRYLLELSSLDVSSNILEFFKLIKSNQNWLVLRKSLKDLLKIETVSNIRMGLINLTAAYFLSDFYKPSESNTKLLKLYHSLIENNSFSEKSNLIIAIYDSCGEVRSGLVR